jgi:hypothetical protein
MKKYNLACLDWKKAKEMGGEMAKKYLEFCK